MNFAMFSEVGLIVLKRWEVIKVEMVKIIEQIFDGLFDLPEINTNPNLVKFCAANKKPQLSSYVRGPVHSLPDTPSENVRQKSVFLHIIHVFQSFPIFPNFNLYQYNGVIQSSFHYIWKASHSVNKLETIIILLGELYDGFFATHVSLYGITQKKNNRTMHYPKNFNMLLIWIDGGSNLIGKPRTGRILPEALIFNDIDFLAI